MKTELTRQRRTIAWRVTRVSVWSAALGGLFAALVAIVAVDRLISHEAERRLRAATVTLAGELDEEREGPLHELVGEVLDDENEEIASSGIGLLVFQGKRRLAGPAWVPLVPPDACETHTGETGRVRACARRYRSWVLVAGQPTDEIRLYWLYGLALVSALGLGAGLGALSSLALTRWAVGPLSALTRALKSSAPRSTHLLDLGDPSEVEEVEAIRDVLAERARQIETLLTQATRFASDAAHELRTPLTALRTELELALEDGAEGDRNALERALSRVVRLTDLVNRLLVLSLPAGNLSAGFEPVALVDVANDVIAELPPEARARIELEVLADGTVRGDAELLHSLVSNALGNAVKFALRGPVVVRIEEREQPDSPVPRLVMLSVIDQGPGVPRELRDRVFEAFFRARADASPGHGLGLALVGHISKVHGGAAAFLEAKQGARLEIVLPAWTAHEPGQGANPPA